MPMRANSVSFATLSTLAPIGPSSTHFEEINRLGQSLHELKLGDNWEKLNKHMQTYELKI